MDHLPRARFLAAALVALCVAPLVTRAADNGAITVFAAASLREAFEAGAPAFTAKTGIGVKFEFAGSDTLAAQIIQGAPADVFASANETQMKQIADVDLIAGGPVTFARNRLVVIVPKANPGHLVAVADLARPGVKIVLGAATVPIGKYARAAFAAMSGKDGVAADFAAAVEQNVVSNETDVKAVATKIALGEGDAGVVYVTDVTPAIAPKVTVLRFAPDASPDATYPIAALKAAPNPSGAAAFVNFITKDGQSYLRARGFLSP